MDYCVLDPASLGRLRTKRPGYERKEGKGGFWGFQSSGLQANRGGPRGSQLVTLPPASPLSDVPVQPRGPEWNRHLHRWGAGAALGTTRGWLGGMVGGLGKWRFSAWSLGDAPTLGRGLTAASPL